MRSRHDADAPIQLAHATMTSYPVPDHSIIPARYRQVLGNYPTGVCVVTGMHENGAPLAMVVGSFTSVSLDPPLVGFFPDRRSNSWKKLRSCDHFCVNILSAGQESLCRKLASRDEEKFAGVAHRLSHFGNPVLDGVVAWIECVREFVGDAGDHEIVLGRVRELEIETGALPLVFYQGAYRQFTPGS